MSLHLQNGARGMRERVQDKAKAGPGRKQAYHEVAGMTIFEACKGLAAENYSISRCGPAITRPRKAAAWGMVAILTPSVGEGAGQHLLRHTAPSKGVRRGGRVCSMRVHWEEPWAWSRMSWALAAV